MQIEGKEFSLIDSKFEIISEKRDNYLKKI